MKWEKVYLVSFSVIALYFAIAGFVNVRYSKLLTDIPSNSYEVKIDTVKKDTVKHVFYGNTYFSEGDVAAASVYIQVPRIYRWILNESEIWLQIIICAFLGSLGACVRIMKDWWIDDKAPSAQKVWIYPWIGILAGFVILSLSYVLPKVLTVNEDLILDAAAITFIAFLAGFQADMFFSWLAGVAANFFPVKK